MCPSPLGPLSNWGQCHHRLYLQSRVGITDVASRVAPTLVTSSHVGEEVGGFESCPTHGPIASGLHK